MSFVSRMSKPPNYAYHTLCDDHDQWREDVKAHTIGYSRIRIHKQQILALGHPRHQDVFLSVLTATLPPADQSLRLTLSHLFPEKKVTMHR